MRDRLRRVVDSLKEKGADYADLRYENLDVTKLVIKDGEVETIKEGKSRGLGIRTFVDGSWGYYSTNSLDCLKDKAEKALKSAKALSKSSQKSFSLQELPMVEEKLGSEAEIEPDSLPVDQKLAILEESERSMMKKDGIKSSKITYSDYSGRYEFLNTEGSYISKKPSHIGLWCEATAKHEDKMESYTERTGTVRGFEHVREKDPVKMGEEAADMALNIVKAPKPPSGKMPVVIGNRLGGLFAHEAVGHAAEADSVLSGDSVFEDKKGSKVASEEVTMVDSPTLESKHGSYTYDSEGVGAERTEVIKKGKLNKFLHSRETASRFDEPPTGNGRADSFKGKPYPRMSNTYFEEGDHSKEDIIGSIDSGIYLKGFKGGQVSTAEGNFMFRTTHAYIIEEGEVKDIVRGPSISGKTLEVLKKVSMVAGDREVGDPGYCGKRGQTVYVDTGSPHMKVDELVVG
ncbi:MAG: TldD/PmbA family protein [Candidatus Nanohaloarchaeota archaeon QJJ-9]|nr:TldD/PmbA family protein [Candidatus Nanohaloarchaeota archaeon QJJ-9]